MLAERAECFLRTIAGAGESIRTETDPREEWNQSELMKDASVGEVFGTTKEKGANTFEQGDTLFGKTELGYGSPQTRRQRQDFTL